MKRWWNLLRWTVLLLSISALIIVVLVECGPRPSRVVSCLPVACPDRLEIVLAGDVPDEYEISVAEGDKQVSLRCQDGQTVPGSVGRQSAPFRSIAPGYHFDATGCTEDGILLDSFAPASFTVTVNWAGGSSFQTFRPEYHLCDHYCCQCATVTMELP